MQPYVGRDQHFDPLLIERVILDMGDSFDIRIFWDRNTVLISGVCALAGGLVGHYAGGRIGAAVGAGLGSVAGVGAAAMLSLRELWSTIKERVQELFYIVFNYLRQLDPLDYMHALNMVLACMDSRRELVYIIIEFIACKLGTRVISSIAAA